jgi:hypothetical protein
MYYSLNPNVQRAKNAITLLWIVLALEIAYLTSNFFQYDLLQTAANGGEITDEAATSNDLRQQILAILYTIAYIISAVTFIMWFRRAYYNLHQRVSYLSQSEGWAAGSWFVPVLNLYRPYQIMKEMYNETRNLLQSRGFSDISITTKLLGWWWALWIVSRFVGQFAFRYSMKAETIDELLTGTVAEIVSGIIGIPLVLIAIRVVKDYSAVEPLLNEITDEEQPNGTVQFLEQEVSTGTYTEHDNL